ncbi:hypothetical protein MTP99_006907 [Tenebrio molitor]|jgi:hypothetical protein|nr:hypothetical protein MTP99_006907 [Tenebrio molitor]
MVNDQVHAITEAYWISLKVGTTTIRGKFHYLPHLPSDIVLGIDILRRYPFTIDLERGSASLRAPATVKAMQLTPAYPALQVSDNSPPTLSIGKGQRRQQPLPEGAPRCVRYTEVRREMERSPTAHRRKQPVPKPAGGATPRTSNDAVHHRKDTSRPDRVKLARALAKNSNLLGDRALHQDHTLPSGAEGSAAKRNPEPSGPHTVPKVLASVAPNPQPSSGPITLRAQASDLRPYRAPEAPADLVNICRMPSQRASPTPTGITSVRQQLRRRLNGQAVLARASREAARQLQERFRRAPQATQEEKTTQPPHCRLMTPTISPFDATPSISPSDKTPTISPSDATPTISPSDKTPTISPSDATPTISPSDAEPTTPSFEAEPTTSPSEAESTPAPATDQTLDLE